ncbi:MAG: LAGLIDADG family homing endonuclease [Thermodesulfovibrionales bacterium]
MSDNLSSADNQQERLIKIGWVTGFVDGEGCFSIGFVRQKDRIGRKGYKIGYQVFHEFAVTQGAKSISCLKELNNFFGIGNVYINTRYDNHKEHLYRYVVRKRGDLLDIIIPFFKKYPMRSSKQKDFAKFAQCMTLIQANQHLIVKGLVKIAGIVQTMNRQKPKDNIIRILRDYTSDPAIAGKI